MACATCWLTGAAVMMTLGTAVVAAMPGPGHVSKPTSPAPDFDLVSIEGGTIHLSSYRGHPVLLNFWATWCAPCRVEMPWLVGLDQRYRSRGLRIIGVHVDDPTTDRRMVAAFARDRGVGYPIVFGTQPVTDAYGGLPLMPASFFIDEKGSIVDRMDGITTRADLESRVARLLSRVANLALDYRPRAAAEIVRRAHA